MGPPCPLPTPAAPRRTRAVARDRRERRAHAVEVRELLVARRVGHRRERLVDELLHALALQEVALDDPQHAAGREAFSFAAAAAIAAAAATAAAASTAAIASAAIASAATAASAAAAGITKAPLVVEAGREVDGERELRDVRLADRLGQVLLLCMYVYVYMCMYI